MRKRECHHFPYRVPAKKTFDKPTIKDICSVNAACAIYISFLYEDVSIRGQRN